MQFEKNGLTLSLDGLPSFIQIYDGRSFALEGHQDFVRFDTDPSPASSYPYQRHATMPTGLFQWSGRLWGGPTCLVEKLPEWAERVSMEQDASLLHPLLSGRVYIQSLEFQTPAFESPLIGQQWEVELEPVLDTEIIERLSDGKIRFEGGSWYGLNEQPHSRDRNKLNESLLRKE